MIRARPVIFPRPWPSRRLYGYAVEVTWDPGDDPLAFMRLLSHFQAAGGGEALLPRVEDGILKWH